MIGAYAWASVRDEEIVAALTDEQRAAVRRVAVACVQQHLRRHERPHNGHHDDVVPSRHFETPVLRDVFERGGL